MIDCCERLALMLVSGNVIALGDSQLGKDWLRHHISAHISAPNASGEVCSVCREAGAVMLREMERDLIPGGYTTVHMRELAATLSELLTQ